MSLVALRKLYYIVSQFLVIFPFFACKNSLNLGALFCWILAWHKFDST